MLQDRMLDRMASLADRGVAFPSHSRRGLLAAFGVAGLAALAPTQLSGVARAVTQPEVFPRSDGRTELRIKLNKGESVHAVGPNGLLIGNDCDNGQFYPGPTVYSAVAFGDEMNFTAVGDPVLSFDPFVVEPLFPSGPTDWTPWAEALRDPTKAKLTQFLFSQKLVYRGLGVALVRGGLASTVFHYKDEESDTDPGRGTLIGCPRPAAQAGAQPTAAPTGGSAVSGQAETKGVGTQQAAGDCDPPQFTTLPDRPPAVIDGKEYIVQRRDKNSGCERTVWSVEPGLRIGQNTRLLLRGTLPGGIPAWSFIVSGVSAAVHREGIPQQTEYKNGDVVVLDSTSEGWDGSVGAYEFWAGVVPGEWRDIVARQRQVLQSIHVGRQVGIATHRD